MKNVKLFLRYFTIFFFMSNPLLFIPKETFFCGVLQKIYKLKQHNSSLNNLKSQNHDGKFPSVYRNFVFFVDGRSPHIIRRHV